MKTFKFTAAQGEVNIRRINELPAELRSVPPENGLLIVGHSESGHHHGFRQADGGVALLERTQGVPEGMKILYAIVENPAELIQDAPGAHESLVLPPGIYEFRISREYNPFMQQARQVAD